ncbi:hypothetical protein U1Q18_032689 [Sarracenia purpurea var. burkii]
MLLAVPVVEFGAEYGLDVVSPIAEHLAILLLVVFSTCIIGFPNSCYAAFGSPNLLIFASLKEEVGPSAGKGGEISSSPTQAASTPTIPKVDKDPALIGSRILSKDAEVVILQQGGVRPSSPASHEKRLGFQEVMESNPANLKIEEDEEDGKEWYESDHEEGEENKDDSSDISEEKEKDVPSREATGFVQKPDPAIIKHACDGHVSGMNFSFTVSGVCPPWIHRLSPMSMDLRFYQALSLVLQLIVALCSYDVEVLVGGCLLVSMFRSLVLLVGKPFDITFGGLFKQFTGDFCPLVQQLLSMLFCIFLWFARLFGADGGHSCSSAFAAVPEVPMFAAGVFYCAFSVSGPSPLRLWEGLHLISLGSFGPVA